MRLTSLAILLGGLALCCGCSRSEASGEPDRAGFVVDLTEGDAAAVEFDLGEIKQAGRAEYAIRFCNRTRRTVQLDQFDISCPCLTVEDARQRIDPGQAAAATLLVNMGAEPDFSGDLAIEVTGYDTSARRLFEAGFSITVVPVPGLRVESPDPAPTPMEQRGEESRASVEPSAERATVSPNFSLAAVAVGVLSSAPRQDPTAGLDLAKIADILQAYYDSIETLWVRTRTVWPVRGAVGLDDFAQMQGLRYQQTRFEGELLSESVYELGDETYLLVGGEIPNVRVSRERIRHRPTLLHGFYGRYGDPVHEILRGDSATLVGPEQVEGGIECVRVDINETGINVAWYFDPKHDYLCRKKVYLDNNGKPSSTWRVVQFKLISERWFPAEVSDEHGTPEDRTWNPSETALVELQIDEPLDPAIFRPVIPDGAIVDDMRGPQPREYVQGGKAALERRLKHAAPSATALGDKVRIGRPTNWVAWTAGATASVSGAILIYAARRRLVIQRQR